MTMKSTVALLVVVSALPPLGPAERVRPTTRTPVVTKTLLQGRWVARVGTTKVDVYFLDTLFGLNVEETTRNGIREVKNGADTYEIDRKANQVRLTGVGQARLVRGRLWLTLRVAVPSLPKGTVLTLTRVPEGP
jgi:hypothetical protein